MRGLLRVVLLALAFSLGTWVFGWWAVPVIAALWGLLARGSVIPGVTAAASAALGWAILLGVDAVPGRLGVLMERVAPVLRLPGIVLAVVAVLFAAAVAWAAASTFSSLTSTGRELRGT